jgi:hypothetical protein
MAKRKTQSTGGPKTLDELLQVVPGMRRQRQLNADWLRTLLDRQRGECTWCGKPVGKGRSTWCGDACVKAFGLRCSANVFRTFVVDRDHGICRACGRDTKQAERDYNAAKKAARHQVASDHPGLSSYGGKQFNEMVDALMGDVAMLYGYARSAFREVEHTVPVVEGGGLCEVDQLHLYCGACHAESTKRLSERRKTKK